MNKPKGKLSLINEVHLKNVTVLASVMNLETLEGIQFNSHLKLPRQSPVQGETQECIPCLSKSTTNQVVAHVRSQIPSSGTLKAHNLPASQHSSTIFLFLFSLPMSYFRSSPFLTWTADQAPLL